MKLCVTPFIGLLVALLALVAAEHLDHPGAAGGLGGGGGVAIGEVIAPTPLKGGGPAWVVLGTQAMAQQPGILRCRPDDTDCTTIRTGPLKLLSLIVALLAGSAAILGFWACRRRRDAPVASPATAADAPAPPCLLIVEPNAELRDLLARELAPVAETLGLGLRAVSSAAAGRRVLLTAPVRLMLCNRNLPQGGALALGRALRDEAGLADAPLLYLVPRDGDGAPAELAALRATAVPVAPLDLPALRAEVTARLTPAEPAAAPEMTRRDAGFMARLDKAMRADPAASVDALAAACGTSPRNFQRHIRRVHGKSFREFSADYRLKLAQDHLLAGMSIAEAAQACGYASASTFGQRFKTAFGASPGQWLRAQAEAGQVRQTR